ncbi:hypothetical protein [Stieleria varia]|uniref:Uncharacterized protein n=1 Tax=Stieleria varia TaxID=2528005 RepID=A0A5C6B021_9BACT|nr:hypothetical protein [Stieleria varia]TWU05635.1 hypothetical protein Pla52n_13500 [Stieleria varia]
MCLKKSLFSLAFCVLCLTAIANGQSTESGFYRPSHHCDRHANHDWRSHGHAVRVVGYRYASPYYGYRTTGFELASVIRAQGEFNLLTAQARSENAAAVQLELQNSVDALAARLERRRINTESRFGHLHAAAEERRLASELRKAEQPVAVAPADGSVQWPLILATTHFARARRPVDLVFAQRAHDGAINPDHYQPLCDWIEQIRCELKDHIHEYSMDDYVQAQSFLRNLVDEARQPISPMSQSTQLVNISR